MTSQFTNLAITQKIIPKKLKPETLHEAGKHQTDWRPIILYQKARSISSHAQSDLQSKHALRLPNRKEENGRQGNTRSSLYESTTTWKSNGSYSPNCLFGSTTKPWVSNITSMDLGHPTWRLHGVVVVHRKCSVSHWVLMLQLVWIGRRGGIVFGALWLTWFQEHK